MSSSQSLHLRPESGVCIVGCALADGDRAEVERRLASRTERILVIPAPDAPGRLNLWRRLPPPIAALAFRPDEVAAIAAAEPVPENPEELWQLVLAALDESSLAVESGLAATARDIVAPPLVPQQPAPRPDWFASRVENLPGHLAPLITSDPDGVALQAGLFQIAGQLERSHDLAQSVEHRGRQRAGDYWHAIHHRREQDFGNARYWFRHVGSHPVLGELAADTLALLASQTEDIAAKFEGVVAGAAIDPVRLTEVVEACITTADEAATAVAVEIQWAEMIRLLSWTWRDAAA